MSSRNQYLSEAEKTTAGGIYHTLVDIKHSLENGRNDFTTLCEQAKQNIEQKGFDIDYIEICREIDLMPAQSSDKVLRILMAAQLGPARLIDNVTCHLA